MTAMVASALPLPAEPLLTREQWERKMRDATRDRSYRATPLGAVVGRYCRWKKNEWGATKETMDSYEPPLAKLALQHPGLTIKDFEPPAGTERLREFLASNWGHCAADTVSKNLAILHDFIRWCIENDLLYGDPTTKIRYPRHRKKAVEVFSNSFVAQVIAGQVYLADKIGCRLICTYGLRRGEFRTLQMRHFDFERRQITVRGKGGKSRIIPIPDVAFWREVGELELEAQTNPLDYLLYRYSRRKIRVPLEEAEGTLDTGKGVLGYAYSERYDHTTKPSKGRIHAWWYRCLVRAGVVPPDTTSGSKMHRGRHTAITELVRTPGVNLKAVQIIAGHASISTTADTYSHFDTSDAEAALIRRLEREGE